MIQQKPEKLSQKQPVWQKNLNSILSERRSYLKKRSHLHYKDIINRIDALWIIPDSTVVTKNSLDTIFKKTLKNRLSIFCTSSAIVKAGALISISPDYRYTGLQAAQL